MYVCMFVCVYVCTYVCMYVWMYVMYVRTYVCMYVRMYVCMYVCMHVYMYVCTYVCIHRLSQQLCDEVKNWRWQLEAAWPGEENADSCNSCQQPAVCVFYNAACVLLITRTNRKWRVNTTVLEEPTALCTEHTCEQQALLIDGNQYEQILQWMKHTAMRGTGPNF